MTPPLFAFGRRSYYLRAMSGGSLKNFEPLRGLPRIPWHEQAYGCRPSRIESRRVGGLPIRFIPNILGAHHDRLVPRSSAPIRVGSGGGLLRPRAASHLDSLHPE